MMEKIVNKFLNGYIGDKIDCRLIHTSKGFWYHLRGKSGVKFYTIRISKKHGGYTVFKDQDLCNMVASIFDISTEDSGNLISKWFKETFNIVKFSDLSQFMDKKG